METKHSILRRPPTTRTLPRSTIEDDWQKKQLKLNYKRRQREILAEERSVCMFPTQAQKKDHQEKIYSEIVDLKRTRLERVKMEEKRNADLEKECIMYQTLEGKVFQEEDKARTEYHTHIMNENKRLHDYRTALKLHRKNQETKKEIEDGDQFMEQWGINPF